jgi:serine/threonine protein kinase
MTTFPFRRINEIHSGLEFKHYRLLEQIGEGGQGCVWSAFDSRRKEVVAIKFSETPEADEKKSVEDVSLQKHIGQLMELRHPYVLPMVDFGTSSQVRFLVSPYIPGGSLEDIVNRGALKPEKALGYAAKIASALDYLHERAVIHRDLKPSNILLDLQHNIYLSDFGLARVISSQTQVMHTGRGTPYYASPEQHTMSEATLQSDIYSFGILVYELLAGQLPWRGEKVMGVEQLQSKEEMPDPREAVPDLPEGLCAVLRQVTATLPEARPESAGKAMHLLYQAFDMLPIEIASAENWDEKAIQNLNAVEIYKRVAKDWQSPAATVPLSLTSFAIVEASPQLEQPSSADACFMLHTAISYGYKEDAWWRRIPALDDRLAVAQSLLQSGQEALCQRTALLLVADRELRAQKFSTQDEIIHNLVKGMGVIQDRRIRHSLLKLLMAILPLAPKWAPVAISHQMDSLLAYQALEDSDVGDEAAKLAGYLRSEQALRTIFKTASPSRRLPALLAALQVAGSLPVSIPGLVRFEALGEWILAQAFARPNQLALMSVLSLLGPALGFGIYTYNVYRLADFLDSARILTAIQHGLFLGAGFLLAIALIRIVVERFPQWPRRHRTTWAILLGSLPLGSVFLLYHTLLLKRYEILSQGLAQLAPLLAGCLLITFGFALSSLFRQRPLKMLISAVGMILALAATWWAHTSLAFRPFPLLYYEYTWPASQVLTLIFFTALPAAIAAHLTRITEPVSQPAGQPNPPSVLLP